MSSAENSSQSAKCYASLFFTDPLRDAGYERVKIWLNSRPLNSYTEICTVTDYTDVPYSVLMKNGKSRNLLFSPQII